MNAECEAQRSVLSAPDGLATDIWCYTATTLLPRGESRGVFYCPARLSPRGVFCVLAKLRARFADLDAEPLSMTSAEFGKFIADKTEKWGKVIRAANIKAE
jgi:hypothetical protein